MTTANIAPFIRGAHHLVSCSDGLVRPSRMADKQIAAAARADRETKAQTSAGVTIDVVTTGDEVSFDLDVLSFVHDSAAVRETIERANDEDPAPNAGLVDGIDLLVDGTYVQTVPICAGTLTLPFDNPTHAPVEVQVYLPNLAIVAVGNLATNATIEPAPKRGYMLALGDSITQGYVVGAPSSSWPALVARARGLDLVNQAIAGHHFDYHTLCDLRTLREDPPTLVFVAYGTNDWCHTASAHEITVNMTTYLERLAECFPTTPIYVLSPIWRADEAQPRACARPLTWMRDQLAGECARLGLHYLDGTNLVDADTALFADGRLHPNAQGARLMAEGLLRALE